MRSIILRYYLNRQVWSKLLGLVNRLSLIVLTTFLRVRKNILGLSAGDYFTLCVFKLLDGWRLVSMHTVG